MIGIGRLIYRATGIMSKKGIMKNCEKIGRTLADEIKAGGGKVEPKRVHELLTETLGKKKAAKITISDDLDTFKAFAKENMKLSDDVAEMYFYNSKSAVLPGRNGKALLSLRTNKMSNTEAVNTTSHELEHVFYNTVSTDSARRRAFMKCLPEKVIQNTHKKVNSILNTAMLDFQERLIRKSNTGSTENILNNFSEHKAGIGGLLKQTGFETREQLQDAIRTMIREDVILPYNNKLNYGMLKAIRRAIQDEARAYKVGGRALKNFSQNENISNSEMIGQLYDEAAIVLKGEIKNQKKNIWRKLFGKPQIDYHIDKPIIVSKGELEHFLKAETIAPEKVPEIIKDAFKALEKAPDCK